ncbi:MAG: CHAT domain-containing protein [Richelia sp. RM1_1_1]|nr:CHAT domain-containing protein [Richelia sp. RM1_1_1]
MRAIAIREKAVTGEYGKVNYSQRDLAYALGHLGGLYQARENYSKAETVYLRAIAILEKSLGREHPDLAGSLDSLGVLYEKQGNYSKAEAVYLRSFTIREKKFGREHLDVASSYNNLASFNQLRGNYSSSESFYLKSLAIREKLLGKNHPYVASSLGGLADLYREQGNYTSSESLHLRALAIRENAFGQEHQDVAFSLNNLAEVYREQGKYTQAEPLFMRSLGIFEKIFGQKNQYVAINLNNLAAIYQETGNFSQAENFFLRALNINERILGSEHDLVAMGLNNLAGLYNSQENYGKAEPLYVRSLAIFEKVFGREHPNVAVSLSNLALYYWGKGDINRATDYLNRGVGVEEKNLQLIYAVGSEQRKQNYAQTFTARTNTVVSLALQQSNKNPTLGKLALTTVLRRKGRVMDAMTDTVQTLQAQLADNPDTKKLFDEWLNIQQQLANLVYRGAGEQKFENYQQQIKKLEAEKEELENRVSAKSAEFRKEIKSVELTDIQAQIPPDAAMVEIVQYSPFNPKPKKNSEKLSQPRYAAVVLRRTGEPKWVDLGDAASIDKSVASFRQVLATAPGTSERGIDVTPVEGKSQISKLQELARNLDKQVMAPIRPLLGDARHLLLSPDGQLNLIPFEALKDDRNKYLVESYAFSYLTTGRDLLRLETTAKQLSNPVVFADINYDRQETTIAANPPVSSTAISRGSQNQRSADFTTLTFGKLKATLAEAEEIKKIFPNTNVITGEKATETAIKQLKTPSILHLATHGFFLPNKEIKPDTHNNNQLDQPKYLNLENPLLRSGLALAGFNERQNKQSNNIEDGVLTALEVAGLNLRGTPLVILSACETGLGNVKLGDGVYGLRRALVIAGSQAQLLSLWQVDDNGTKDLMVKYYERIKAGKGRHAALREVQLEFLKNPKYQHPYYWASFIPSGNWQPMK